MRKNAREGSRLEDDGVAADCRYSGRFNAHTRRIEGKRERGGEGGGRRRERGDLFNEFRADEKRM